MFRLRPHKHSLPYLGSNRNGMSLHSETTMADGEEPNRVVWHNPNPEQMVETLKVVMMTQATTQPVPVQYNSCILHVLESYHDMRLELTAKERETAELKKAQIRAQQGLEEQVAQWRKRENEYKAELKKLEVMLARDARGLDLVTLARTDSTLKRLSDTTWTTDLVKGSMEDEYKEIEQATGTSFTINLEMFILSFETRNDVCRLCRTDGR